MQILIKVLLSILKKIALAACGEAIIEYIVFETLEMAVKHSKTEFDDRIVEQLKESYKANKKANKESLIP